VNSDLILDVHLVELIDAADAVVSQHKGTSFDAELSSLGVFADTCRQTRSVGSLATTVDSAGEELADVLEELRFSCGWVAHDADVDVASQLYLVVGVLLDAAK